MKTHFYTTERERERERQRERKKLPIPKDASFYQPSLEVNNLGVRNYSNDPK